MLKIGFQMIHTQKKEALLEYYFQDPVVLRSPQTTRPPPPPPRVMACASALVNIKQNRENEHSGFQRGGSTARLAVELIAGFPLSTPTASAEWMAATVLVTVPAILQCLKSEYY